MIYSLKGKITRVDDNIVVVDVNGVGYEVCCSFNTIDELVRKQDATVYTYMAVREDAVALFGFSSLEEKRMFTHLISVSGIGPKMAITILSGMSTQGLASAVVNQNISLLTKIKGLGKKTAERVVLELKEKVDAVVKQGSSPMDGFANTTVEVMLTNEMNDAIAVLVELGIKKEEAIKLVKQKADPNDKADVIIRKCL